METLKIMKAPIERIRVSTRGRDILIKVKRNTGLEHWNEICRIALCRSLSSPTTPQRMDKMVDSSIEMDWKTFAGEYQTELTALTLLKAHKDGVDVTKKDALADYFRAHLERGIAGLQNIRDLKTIYTYTQSRDKDKD